MWCANCQDDVATEISNDGHALQCTTCGEPVRQVFAPSLHPETKSARELLKKWAEEQKQLTSSTPTPEPPKTDLDQTEPTATSNLPQGDPTVVPRRELSAETQLSSASADSETDQPSVSNDQPKPATPDDQVPAADKSRPRPKFRVDSAHDSAGQHQPIHRPGVPSSLKNRPSTSPETDSRSSQAMEDRRFEEQGTPPADSGPSAQLRHYDDQLHEQPPAPHFDLVTAQKKAKSRPGRIEAIWGQLMAYAGVGVLTVGTVMVLWGYFGMVEHFASTGWLLSTAGQMLLLLGLVTLISGGMQQTTHEVTERIEYLGGRMIRIEQSTDQLLKGPHFSKRAQDRETRSSQQDNSTA